MSADRDTPSSLPALVARHSTARLWRVDGEIALTPFSTVQLLKDISTRVSRGRLWGDVVGVRAAMQATRQQLATATSSRNITTDNKAVGSGKIPEDLFTTTEITALIWGQVAADTAHTMQTLASTTSGLSTKRRRLRADGEDDWATDPVTAYMAETDSVRACGHGGWRRNHYKMSVGWPTSDNQFTCAARLVCSGLPSVQPDFLVPISVDECANEITMMCLYAFGVNINAEQVQSCLAPLCSMRVEPTKFLAHTILRGNCMSEIVGASLAQTLPSFMHRRDFKLDDISFSDASPDITQHLLTELIATRQTINRYKELAMTGAYTALTNLVGANTMFTGTVASASEPISAADARRDRFAMIAHSMVEYVAKLNVTFRHVKQTLQDALPILRAAANASTCFGTIRDIAQREASIAADGLLGDSTLRRHSGYVEDAIDMLTADRVAKAYRTAHYTTKTRSKGELLFIWLVMSV